MTRRPDLATAAWRKLRLHILERDGWQCTYCGRPVEGRDAQVDHITPFVSVEESNHPHNLVAACSSCNGSKQDRVHIRQNWYHRGWINHL